MENTSTPHHPPKKCLNVNTQLNKLTIGEQIQERRLGALSTHKRKRSKHFIKGPTFYPSLFFILASILCSKKKT